MLGPFARRSRSRRVMLNLTSLIDVMFMLVIFLVVTTTFRQQMGIAIDLPEAATADQRTAESHDVVVSKMGKVYVDNVEQQWESLAQWMREQARNADASVVLRADEGAPFGVVVHVLDLARQCGLDHLFIPTEPIKEGR